MNESQGEKIFTFHAPIRDLDVYRGFVEAAARLRPYGRVQVDISAIADKSWHEMPPGGSPWHEYAIYNPTLYKFFPHPKIAPHLPEDFVAQNRELLLAKAEILQEGGLEAHFWSYEPNHLPESFFLAHPHLRGPRVDHPRRSRREAFAMCVDLDESLEIVAWMMEKLKKSVPGLATFEFKTNDAGSGLCWATAQYSGPNGPRHCRGRHAGERMRGLVEAMHRGAEAGGGPIDVWISNSNLGGAELDLIKPLLPGRTYLRQRESSTTGVHSGVGGQYPVLGLVDPVAILRSAERYHDPRIRRVFFGFGCSYGRAHERLDTVHRVLDIVEDGIRRPTRGLVSRMERLRELAAGWAGEQTADAVVEAFYGLNQSFRLKQAIAPRFRTMYMGVSNRCVTRPLLVKPEVLTAEEESYFLPHVFNIHESEARTDYIDLHGGRIGLSPTVSQGKATSIPGLEGACSGVLAAAKTFESAGAGLGELDSPEPVAGSRAAWLGELAKSLRIWASIVRSCSNFFFAQTIRDRNREAISGEPRIPEKVPNATGHPDYIPFNRLVRDELDNANELIALLESGGLEFLHRAREARYEDTFVLGPDVVDQLTRKVRIMREHWLDIERYLACPHK